MHSILRGAGQVNRLVPIDRAKMRAFQTSDTSSSHRMRASVIAVWLMAACCTLGSTPSHGLPAEKALPRVFVAVLPEIKARTRVPVLLPSELPSPIRDAKHAIAEQDARNEYAVALCYELGVGDAASRRSSWPRVASPAGSCRTQAKCS
jgi:hypothetical protein